MSVKAATDKHFRRARVKPVARRGGRAWLTWRMARGLACVLVAAYAAYRGFGLVLSASTLQVRRIAVHGNVRLSAGEVQAMVEGLRGTNILMADLNVYRRKLLDSPWVADVALRRELPSTVEVFVSERCPMGLSRLGAQLYLIDRSGTVIDEFGPKYAEFDLPIIDGLVRPPSSGQPAIDERRAELAGRVIDALEQRHDLAARLSQIDVSDVHDAVVLLDGDPAMLHVGEDKFLERLQAYDEVAAALRDRVPEIDYVDLRFGQRLYVRPAYAKGSGGAGSAYAKAPASAQTPGFAEAPASAEAPAGKSAGKPAGNTGTSGARATAGRPAAKHAHARGTSGKHRQ
jgi:cell division protein FtsQ